MDDITSAPRQQDRERPAPDSAPFLYQQFLYTWPADVQTATAENEIPLDAKRAATSAVAAGIADTSVSPAVVTAKLAAVWEALNSAPSSSDQPQDPDSALPRQTDYARASPPTAAGIVSTAFGDKSVRPVPAPGEADADYGLVPIYRHHAPGITGTLQSDQANILATAKAAIEAGGDPVDTLRVLADRNAIAVETAGLAVLQALGPERIDLTRFPIEGERKQLLAELGQQHGKGLTDISAADLDTAALNIKLARARMTLDAKNRVLAGAASPAIAATALTKAAASLVPEMALWLLGPAHGS